MAHLWEPVLVIRALQLAAAAQAAGCAPAALVAVAATLRVRSPALVLLPACHVICRFEVPPVQGQ